MIAIILHYRNTNAIILYTMYTALRNIFELQQKQGLIKLKMHTEEYTN